MTWALRRSVSLGAAILTDAWPDLARLPQPVLHRDELRLLIEAKATPERYADVLLVKRLFRGAWVTAAFRPRRHRKPRSRGFPGLRGYIQQPIEESDE